ncbi:ion transporter [bacterium J17]|nr:ion transporter [bacterium J17]
MNHAYKKQTMGEDQFKAPWRRKLHDIIFEADSPEGKLFDVLLLIAIVLSVVAVMLDSVEPIYLRYGTLLRGAEWFFTILFSIEYVLRIISVQRPFKYIFSFFGIIDFLSIIPTYLSIFFFGTQYFVVVRSVRLLRIFRVLKLARYLGEAEVLMRALRASRHKIVVFLSAVFAITVIAGSAMYVVEGAESGFTSIPKGMYWAVVTLTTVGYGDIAPQSTFGQTISALLMIAGYGIIAVPTGIVSVELSRAGSDGAVAKACLNCGLGAHDHDANFCKLCGVSL